MASLLYAQAVHVETCTVLKGAVCNFMHTHAMLQHLVVQLNSLAMCSQLYCSASPTTDVFLQASNSLMLRWGMLWATGFHQLRTVIRPWSEQAAARVQLKGLS